MNYLEFDDPTAYEGLEKRVPQGAASHECPKCKGHGGWILRKNAYGEGKHFMSSCSDCNGWGYTAAPVTCIHDWDSGKNVGRCLHTYTCVKCGVKQTVDSSD